MRRVDPDIRSEAGFTLVELLVVILIIGVLAAIAIPSFLDQTSKADDATAEEVARSASQAAETYETEHSGSYAGIDVKTLSELDRSLQTAEGSNNAYLSAAVEFEGGKGYVVTSVAPSSKDTYTITRTASGDLKRTCTAPPGSLGCRSGVW
jgi:type IV pilus assembly protein PilA